ncbi:YidB family protein [Streptomyces sp. NBC_00069]|uniref:YidB family protein n=1 Tax=Streptomyces sp. NBC_00069 TaxID=2975639 RepID=UPI003246C9AD|nr:YidB family protein [Streptomyces sp. NBC_00998]
MPDLLRQSPYGGAGNILGALLGAIGGGGGNGAQAAGGGNPLGSLMDMLAKSDLADQAQSWVGTGENKTVSGAEIAQALPDEVLQKAAEKRPVWSTCCGTPPPRERRAVCR